MDQLPRPLRRIAPEPGRPAEADDFIGHVSHLDARKHPRIAQINADYFCDSRQRHGVMNFFGFGKSICANLRNLRIK
jgi:hypothetical protein